MTMIILRTKVSVDFIGIAPDYNSKRKDINNFALIELAREVDTSIFTPVCLPQWGQEFYPQEADMFGSEVKS